MARRYHYQEWDTFAGWVHLVLWFCAPCCIVPALAPLFTGSGGTTLPHALLLLGIGLAIPGLLYGFMGSLRTGVTEESVEISWGLAGVIRKVIPFSEVAGMEPVTYRPIAEFGGWGIRVGGGKKRAWTVRGDQALVMHLKDGTLLYLGSKHPARLEERIRSAMSFRKASEER